MGKRLLTVILLAAVIATALAACVPAPSVTLKITPPTQNPAVIQRNATLTVPTGTYGMATASCGTGETMVSGGWSTPTYLPANTLGVLASYPSDSAGAPPLTQGQAETSWTVRATNPTTMSVTYTVSADCLVGAGSPITNGVWYQNAGGYIAGGPLLRYAAVECPDTVSALTGGGFDYQPVPANTPSVYGFPFGTSEAELDLGGNLAWVVLVWSTSAIGYAVCVTAPNVAQGSFESTMASTLNETSPGQYQADAVASCAQNELLAGGGFTDGPSGGVINGHVLISLGWPLTTDAMALGTPPVWQVEYNSSKSLTFAQQAAAASLRSEAVCLQITPPPHIRFDFSNYHHLLRIPADVVVATDGSGQVKATLVTTSVSQVQSAPIAAVQTIGARVTYAVPAGCGDPSPASVAATSALTAQLARAVAAGQVAFGSPSVSINRGSLTCSPPAGTQRTAPFTYTQALDGSATQGTYTPGDVFSYQMQQLRAGVRQLGSPYVLGNMLVCPSGPSLQSATATRATVACAAYGVAEWPWSDQALRALAAQVAGKSQSQALAILNGTPGIEPGSAMLSLPRGVTITTLPTNPDQIALFIAIAQDTAPVVRTP